MSDFKIISPREAYAAYMRGSMLVDVRKSDSSFATPDLKNLVKIPYAELDKRCKELPSNRPIILISKIGINGSEAAKLLSKKGFNDVSVVDGGISAWKEEGFPVR